jgi:hypothetical protein
MRRLLIQSSIVLAMGIVGLMMPEESSAEGACGPYCYYGGAECSTEFIREICPITCGEDYTSGACSTGGGNCGTGIWFMCAESGGT